jgi:hypothetical protein
MHRRFRHLGALVATAIWLVPEVAQAGKYDLDLTRLGRQSGGQVVQDNAAFRSLSSELGTIMAPQPMDPADSLGLSGFAVSADFTINTIAGDRGYWQDTTSGSADNVAPSMQIVGRKGLWPGIEVGGGATHLFDSRMWAMFGYGKVALHEGFHHLYIPAVALRGSFSRLVGAKDLNLTTAAAAVTASWVFGLGKTFSLTPYAGYEALFIFGRSRVLSAAPHCDEFPDLYNNDCAGVDRTAPTEFVFRDAGTIVRHRPHVGVRMIFSVIRLGLEGMWVPAGSRDGSIAGETVADGSAMQQQYTFSVGFDF